jgi:hypothetical protein
LYGAVATFTFSLNRAGMSSKLPNLYQRFGLVPRVAKKATTSRNVEKVPLCMKLVLVATLRSDGVRNAPHSLPSSMCGWSCRSQRPRSNCLASRVAGIFRFLGAPTASKP